MVKKKKTDKVISYISRFPNRVAFAAFLLIILVGTALFCLPISTRSAVSFSFPEALFFSVSSLCAVGFSDADTLSVFTPFGKTVLLILLQMGGIGVNWLAFRFLVSLQQNTERKDTRVLSDDSGYLRFSDIRIFFKMLVLVTFVSEGVGALLLSFFFVPQSGWIRGMQKAVFYSISAFCNGGVILPDVVYDSPSVPFMWGMPIGILCVLSLLSIFGGLGYPVWRDLLSRRKKKRWEVHTKVILSGTLFLLVFGTLLFWGIEVYFSKEPAFLALSPIDKIISCFFLSVTSRTAGFYSPYISGLHIASQLIFIVFMFIGCGTISTGGGVKIPAVFLTAASAFSDIAGKKETVVFQSKVKKKVVYRALVLLVSALLLVFLLSFLLALTERESLKEGVMTYLDILFLCVSSVSSVGLSTVKIGSLSGLGQALLIPAMIIGRIGPFSMVLIFISKKNKVDRVVRPDVQIHL